MGVAWKFWRRQPLVRKLLAAHMRGPCNDGETVSHAIKPIERINLQMAQDHWLEKCGEKGRLIGYNSNAMFGSASIAQLLQDDVVLSPVQRQRVPRTADEEMDCVVRGVYLLQHEGCPVAVLLSQSDYRPDGLALELMAREAVRRLLEEVNRALVYKGKTIFLEEDRAGGLVVRFRKLPPTPREALVLPEKLLSVIERNVIGLYRRADVLRRSGRSTRHGLLLHGPPGTGKTLMLRYLASACPQHTVVLLTGRELSLVRESCQVARMLAPSLVILEDVDLIGENRADNRCPALLHELMDEMDGLGTRAEVVFILTTNRPDVLEPALSSRPGRIDQAIEFPLPDEECRARLFCLYGQGLDLHCLDLPRWVEKSQGASPAFIEELLRKAALMAAERGETIEPLPLTDDDVAGALDELICFGGELTQKLLGYRSFGFYNRS
jgi:hypothetical protein